MTEHRGPSLDEFLEQEGVLGEFQARAIKEVIAWQLAEAMKEPGFWTGRLATLDYRGRNLDEIVKGIDAYNAFTTDDVKQTFAKYDVPESRINVRVSPSSKSEAEAKDVPPKN